MMKKTAAAFMIAITSAALFSGCAFKKYEALVRSTMTVDNAVAEKLRMDAAANPAQKYILAKDLADKIIYVDDAVVKDIIPSTDIDYQFCVVAQIQHAKGMIEFYIYSKDNGTIAKMEKGKTKISAVGDFRRFFNLLGDAFVMIDVVDADLSIAK